MFFVWTENSANMRLMRGLIYESYRDGLFFFFGFHTLLFDICLSSTSLYNSTSSSSSLSFSHFFFLFLLPPFPPLFSPSSLLFPFPSLLPSFFFSFSDHHCNLSDFTLYSKILVPLILMSHPTFIMFYNIIL